VIAPLRPSGAGSAWQAGGRQSGAPLVLERLTRAVVSVEVAIGARTAAIFRVRASVRGSVRDGRVAALVLPGATQLQGPAAGLEGAVGAIGVPATRRVDEDIARAGWPFWRSREFEVPGRRSTASSRRRLVQAALIWRLRRRARVRAGAVGPRTPGPDCML
jgi:hypothetical protein